MEVVKEQSPVNSNKPILYLRVSTLSHMEICSKRSKTEAFSKNKGSIPYTNKSALAEGKKLHRQYGYYITDFERERVRRNLELYKIKGAFQKIIVLPDITIVIRGDYDDLRIIRMIVEKNIKRLVSFIEVKTTRKKYMWNLEVRAAIRQLQLYLWLLEELVTKIGYSLWKRHYLEIFSQNTGRLLRRIPVQADPDIEKWIIDAVYQFMGLRPMRLAPYKYCIKCPQIVKQDCFYYHLRREENAK